MGGGQCLSVEGGNRVSPVVAAASTGQWTKLQSTTFIYIYSPADPTKNTRRQTQSIEFRIICNGLPLSGEGDPRVAFGICLMLLLLLRSNQ